jgi:hypothetical protein
MDTSGGMSNNGTIFKLGEDSESMWIVVKVLTNLFLNVTTSIVPFQYFINLVLLFGMQIITLICYSSASTL